MSAWRLLGLRAQCGTNAQRVEDGMTRNRDRKRGFLMRLLHSRAGNVLPITAAMLIPLLGVVGGGVDMARLYLVKARMQQACDAGALAGRKAMGTGTWTTGGATTNEGRALALFDGNFKSGDYGATLDNRPSFSEADGTVTGTATATVDMTVMRALGFSQKSVSVNCTAKMEIPNTDVMFVLDVTGSMNSAIPGDTVTKINGLKTAVKCFYEALVKVNTAQVCGSDPTATTYSGQAQIRLGFVPYSVNVNVGKLLPNDYLADTWDYQSRIANTTPVWTWTAGAMGSTTWGSWPSFPSSVTNSGSYSGWSNIGSSGSTTVNGTSWPNQYSGKNSTTCPQLNTMGNILDYTETGSLQSATSSAVAPNHSDSVLTTNWSQDNNYTLRGYKYVWSSSKCRLQRSNNRTVTLTRTGTSTAPLTWTQVQQVTGWTYQQRSLDVSGLKAGGSNWNSSVALPISSTTMTVNLEGQTGSSVISVPANTSVTWDGCIEERQTVKNSDGDPSDEWSPIPSNAYDMDINTVPSATTGTHWGPLIGTSTNNNSSYKGPVWARYTGSSTDTIADVVTTSNLYGNYSYSCPVQAKKLQEWTTASPFETYVNSLSPGGKTYHDIGMIWGARFISPTGIFAAENAATPTGQPIQRHIIFMTDGDTNACKDDYTAYGVSWWDRRQTTYAPVDRAAAETCGDSDVARVIDAHLTALCTAIKNQNITLWVVSYGALSGSTATRLQNCATSGKYFLATDSTTLLNQFRQIAAEISDLRLTS